MKIIAVIPARAGSKGVPNKNIRLINGKPMVWYAINNAMKSQKIDEVIVTTDSVVVGIVARQLGAKVRERAEELCRDAVTLDAVIYDAIKDEECDYVITMQPTSPTLKRETLDDAIDYAIKKDTDTLISVINAPHLSWKEQDGKKVPNYTERLNRQYLPANYLETGAFVVSKRSCVTENTRIGEKVDVYEVSETEAVDVDNFIDLLTVENILNQEKVAIYVNGNNNRGMGHVYRALEIADAFYTKPDIYYDINQTSRDIFGRTTHNLIGVNGIGELFDIIKEKQYNIFINDILSTSIDYMIALRHALPNARIVNFEDDGEGIHKADIVINALYEQSEYPNVRAGEKYYIASKMFMMYEPIKIKEKVKNIIITFGGADPQNYSDRLLEIVSKDKYKDYNFCVVLGREKKNVEKLMEYNDMENISVIHNVSNMPELMSESDIAITSRGRTGYELAMLGVPTIAMAQNKREEQHGFMDRANGFDYLGLNPSDYMIEATLDMYINMNIEERTRLQKLLLSHDLKNGLSRVMGLIRNA